MKNVLILCFLQVLYHPPEDNSVEDFICRNNIFLFVRSLVNHFKLETEVAFFDPPCLYEYQDIGKVNLFILYIFETQSVCINLSIKAPVCQ